MKTDLTDTTIYFHTNYSINHLGNPAERNYFCKSFEITAFYNRNESFYRSSCGDVIYSMEMRLGNVRWPQLTYSLTVMDREVQPLNNIIYNMFLYLSNVSDIRTIHVVPK